MRTNGRFDILLQHLVVHVDRRLRLPIIYKAGDEDSIVKSGWFNIVTGHDPLENAICLLCSSVEYQCLHHGRIGVGIHLYALELHPAVCTHRSINTSTHSMTRQYDVEAARQRAVYLATSDSRNSFTQRCFCSMNIVIVHKCEEETTEMGGLPLLLDKTIVLLEQVFDTVHISTLR